MTPGQKGAGMGSRMGGRGTQAEEEGSSPGVRQLGLQWAAKAEGLWYPPQLVGTGPGALGGMG